MEFKLKAQPRERKEKLDKDQLAGVVYGKGLESRSIKMSKPEFLRVFNEAGESNLIELDLEGEKFSVLVKEIQTHPVNDLYIHVDFYQVNMKEKITTEIPLEFFGESKAVKELGGIIIKELTEIEVECLPGDLVDHIEVDISKLEDFNDVIKVSELNVPKKMEVLNDADTVVAMVTEPREEEEAEPEPAAAEEAGVDKVEVEGEKKEGSEGKPEGEDEGKEKKE